MTKQKTRVVSIAACDFCGFPAADHEGGIEIKGIAISGHFCKKECFDSWVKWKAAFIPLKVKSPVLFPQPGQTEGQAVLPV